MRAPPITFDRARELRSRLSPPEVRLWKRLRVRDPDRPPIRRQHPVGPYILDFYCPAVKLAIEVDGWSHNMGDPDHDASRDAWLATQGIEVMRYSAGDVLREPDEVSAGIVAAIMERIRLKQG
jgi:very-short-patch-repair endonuclease